MNADGNAFDFAGPTPEPAAAPASVILLSSDEPEPALAHAMRRRVEAAADEGPMACETPGVL